MFNPTRDQARQFFVEAWRKYRVREVLTPMEGLVADIILAHPEYHALLENEEASLARDYLPESGELNPFLHLALHLLHARAHLQDDGHAGDVHAQVAGEREDELQPLQVLLGVEAGVALGARRLQQPFALVQAQRLRVDVVLLRHRADHVVGLAAAPRHHSDPRRRRAPGSRLPSARSGPGADGAESRAPTAERRARKRPPPRRGSRA